MAIVVDASATLAWLFGEVDPIDWLEVTLQQESLLAPSLWQLEVVQAVLKKERQHQVTSHQADDFLQVLDAMAIDVVDLPHLTLQGLAAWSRPHQLSTYDVTYLALAVERQAELLTLDNNLKLAAQRLSIAMVGA